MTDPSALPRAEIRCAHCQLGLHSVLLSAEAERAIKETKRIDAQTAVERIEIHALTTGQAFAADFKFKSSNVEGKRTLE